MPQIPKDIRQTVKRIIEWAEGHKLKAEARRLCKLYISAEAKKPNSLNGFNPDEIKINFVRQMLIFCGGNTPHVDTVLSMDVYNGMGDIGTFTLRSQLNGKTMHTQIDVNPDVVVPPNRV